MSSSEFWVGPHNTPDTYRLVSLLGGGGEGEVWEAVLPLSTEGRRSVAVKIMRAVGGRDEAQRWDRFGHLLRSLSHPGLVRVTDVFTGPGMHRAGESVPTINLYVVMDHIEGTTLREWSVDNPDTTASKRLRMLRMVASALDEMHSGASTEVPVAHGDVKPANIVVRPDGGAVLVDLGLTRLTDATGVMGRSAPYAAPELRVPGAMATPEADRYAFAVATAQALTAQPPPLGPDGWLDAAALEELLSTHPMTSRRHQLVHEIMIVITAPPEARPRQLRPWLDGAVDSLSQITSDDQPSAATTPIAAYQPAGPYSGRTETTRRLDEPALDAPPPRRRRALLIAAAAALVVVLAAAGAVGLNQLTTGQVATAGPATITATSTALVAPTTDPTTDPTSATPTTDPASSGGSSTSTRFAAPVGSGAITYLTDLTPIQGSWSYSSTLSIDGTSYAHGLDDQDCGSPSPPRTREYDLGRGYTKIQAVLGMSDETDSAAIFQAEFFVDGLPQGKFTVQRGTVQHIDIPLRGTLTFKIIVSTIKGARCDRQPAGLALGDPKLIS